MSVHCSTSHPCCGKVPQLLQTGTAARLPLPHHSPGSWHQTQTQKRRRNPCKRQLLYPAFYSIAIPDTCMHVLNVFDVKVHCKYIRSQVTKGVSPYVHKMAHLLLGHASLGAFSFFASSFHPDACGENGLPLTPNSVKILGRFHRLTELSHRSLCTYAGLVRAKNGKGEEGRLSGSTDCALPAADRLIQVSEFHRKSLEDLIKSRTTMGWAWSRGAHCSVCVGGKWWLVCACVRVPRVTW